MSEQKNPVIHEQYDGAFTLTSTVGSVLTAVSAVLLTNHDAPPPGDMVVTIFRWLSIGLCAIFPALTVRLLLCKVRVDENGVSVDYPLTGTTAFDWPTIRTAAVVRVGVGYGNGQKLIILSSKDPEQVLTRKALLMGKGLSAREHVRITHSRARQAAVEHYLRMTLPEIDV
jgi:hypothetical protein